MKITFSTNDYVTIYPNKKGWEKIKELLEKKYNFNELGIKIITENRLDDGGYRDLLWHIIEDLNEMFFHSQSYFENTNITLEP